MTGSDIFFLVFAVLGGLALFIFGMNAPEAEKERAEPIRRPENICNANPEIRDAASSIQQGVFSNGDRELFKPLASDLLSDNDPYLVLKDLEDYLRCQDEVGQLYKNQKAWTKKSILNVSRMGKFSTDRAIREYARDIWGVKGI